MNESARAGGFEVERPPPGSDFDGAVTVNDLVPEADWFWRSLQWYCDSGCCGLDAFEFSEVAVRNALGHDLDMSDSFRSWTGEVGDVDQLITQLSTASTQLRQIESPFVSTALFNHIVTPAALADLMDHLAANLRVAKGHETPSE